MSSLKLFVLTVSGFVWLHCHVLCVAAVIAVAAVVAAADAAVAVVEFINNNIFFNHVN
jgi:hypothetical protein